MPTSLKIDFVSDVSCPWCAVGLWSLQLALAELCNEVVADIHFQPFELNPKMGPGGQDIGEHLTQKYGSTPAQQSQIREVIRQRGAEVGFTFNMAGRGRIYNTFDAHRLLHWAGELTPSQPGAQLALKQAQLKACHEHRQAMDEHPVLLAAVGEAGLNVARAAQVLASAEFAQAVREQQAFYAEAGIRSVPAVVVNDRHLISGGQPVEAYVRALRQIAAEG
ncbi:DsbA family oxidoreductase [Aquabacterium parvum]|uniref:DsbA family oxidoreductase n=1 Tax=Aquabacterium parvum TaxID=70584 RepID=UPI000718EDC7|nr:DsbA family oxidoreductase [Aquabacterium parvum]